LLNIFGEQTVFILIALHIHKNCDKKATPAVGVQFHIRWALLVVVVSNTTTIAGVTLYPVQKN
jgi:hypothetical protein